MPHILMLRPLHADAIALLKSRPDVTVEILEPVEPAILNERIAAADAISVRNTSIPGSLIARTNKLRVVARHGVGYDAVDVPALTARRIPLMVTSQANAVSVAEHAVAMILGIAKRLIEQDAMMRGGGWGPLAGRPMVDLAGRTALVIGFGRIGHRTARFLKVLGMRTLVIDPYVDAAKIAADGHEVATDLDAALREAQVVSIHCPKTPETTNLLDARRLKLLPKHAILVNTARGGIINEPALIEVLGTDHLLGAGIDVFEDEPTPRDNALFKFPHVIFSPHLAGITAESLRRMGVQCAQNMLDALDGKPDPEMVINKEVL